MSTNDSAPRSTAGPPTGIVQVQTGTNKQPETPPPPAPIKVNPKVQLAEPEARPIPSRGWQKWLYKFIQIVTFGKSTFVPKLGKKEVAELQRQADELAEQAAAAEVIRLERERALEAQRLERERVLEERQACIDHINARFKRDKVSVVLAVCNQDGGTSKTWISILLSLVFAEYTRLQALYVELRRGTDLGIELLGVDPESTLSIRDFHRRLAEFKTGLDFHERLSTNSVGVAGIKTDTDTPDPADDPLDRETAKALVQTAALHFPLVVLDTANVPTDPINLGGLDAANVFLYPTKPGTRPVRLCRMTAETLQKQSVQGANEHRVFMVNMLRDGQKPEDYRDRLGAHHNEEVCGSYFDPAADYEKEEDPVASLAPLQEQTIDSLLHALKAVVDKAFEAQQVKPRDNLVALRTTTTGTE